MIEIIHGGNCLRRNIIDFSVNINPLGLPEGVKDIISDNIDAVLRYPEPSSEGLKRELALSHKVRRENIAVGNGSIEFIHLIPGTFKIKRALIITPTFSEYEFAVRSNGSTPIFLNTREKDGFRIDCGKIAELLPRCDAIFLCNPNNPTGTILPCDDVLHLARLAKRHKILFILDEAFIEFTNGSKETAIVSETLINGSFVILRSLTKFFAIPGLRLGYAIGHERVIKKITEHQYPWNVNGPAQLAGVEAPADKKYIERTRLLIAKERRHMFERLTDIKGLKVYPASANFILCKLQNTPVHSSIELNRRLLREGIYVRACGNFRGLNDGFFRAAVRKRADNDLLINSIKKAIR